VRSGPSDMRRLCTMPHLLSRTVRLRVGGLDSRA
jgi:hypothetical protein